MELLSNKRRQIESLVEDWKDCTRCRLGCMAQNHVLFEVKPEGVLRLDILFIGEAPGPKEDDSGRPFIGPAGTLLRETLLSAGIAGLLYGFTNTVACKPQDAPQSKFRQPEHDEVVTCAPRLAKIVDIFRPKTVVLVGSVARDYSGWTVKDAGFAGKLYNIYHPSYILRQGGKNAKLYPAYLDQLTRIIKELK